MKASLLLVSFLLSPVIGGCSVLGLDDLDLATCVIDDECAPFNEGLGPDACERFVCDFTARRCVQRSLDADGDGESPPMCGGNDCNDDAPGILPGATEVCDGVDGDCNGLLDGPDEDDDGDGFADQCAGAAALDCNDSDPLTYFDAPELCDGLDNDCVLDGFRRFTGGVQLERSEDRDNDGHSDVDALCDDSAAPDLFPRDDCDDEDSTVFAGAPERCDGIDNDCDGTPDNAVGSTTPGSACRPLEIVAGVSHTCVLNADGTAACFGSNAAGELGDQAAPDDAAILIPIGEFVDLAAGNLFTCGARRDGSVACWGRDVVLRAGEEFMIRGGAFGTVSGVSDAVQVTAGDNHACALTSMGTVWCWGLLRFGVVDGTWPGGADVVLAREVPGATDMVQIDAGQNVNCGARSNGEVICWGANFGGSLGTGDTDSSTTGVQTVVGISNAQQAVAGAIFGCALLADSTVSCWGSNTKGALGCGSGGGCPADTGSPVPVVGLSDAVELVAGTGSHICARRATGGVTCWGDNSNGQLGDDSETDRFAPVDVTMLADVTALAAGTRHSCAVNAEGTFCWGQGNQRQLGDGRTSHPGMSPFRRTAPRPVSVLANVVEYGLGGDGCYRTPDLKVRCAGASSFGELESGSGFPGYASVVFDEIRAISVDNAGSSTCLVDVAGAVHCFGDSRNGRLGSPDGGLLEGLEGAVDVELGNLHGCVLLATGGVSCWGDHTQGQVGIGNPPLPACGSGGGFCSPTPAAVPVSSVRQVAAGRSHTCALLRQGEVECWGANDSGQLGSGPLGRVPSPRRVVGLPAGDPMRSISAGFNTTCAVGASGDLYCWGTAIGTGAGGVDPIRIAELSGVQEVALTGDSACARLTSGRVRCWGSGLDGRLGNGSTSSSATPVNVIGLGDARTLDCGDDFCCATRTSGQTVCWGDNSIGEQASASTSDQTVPGSVVDFLLF